MDYEVARACVEGGGSTRSAHVVVRTYAVPRDALFRDDKPIKFVPMSDIGHEFDVAIYIPDYLVRVTPPEILIRGLQVMVKMVGSVYLTHGPDAVSRLG